MKRGGERKQQSTYPNHIEFIEDMQVAGFEVEHYEGRNYWKGPAARNEDYGEVMDKCLHTR